MKERDVARAVSRVHGSSRGVPLLAQIPGIDAKRMAMPPPVMHNFNWLLSKINFLIEVLVPVDHPKRELMMREIVHMEGLTGHGEINICANKLRNSFGLIFSPR